eukprot:4240392-Amphidinium_carterae.4
MYNDRARGDFEWKAPRLVDCGADAAVRANIFTTAIIRKCLIPLIRLGRERVHSVQGFCSALKGQLTANTSDEAVLVAVVGELLMLVDGVLTLILGTPETDLAPLNKITESTEGTAFSLKGALRSTASWERMEKELRSAVQSHKTFMPQLNSILDTLKEKPSIGDMLAAVKTAPILLERLPQGQLHLSTSVSPFIPYAIGFARHQESDTLIVTCSCLHTNVIPLSIVAGQTSCAMALLRILDVLQV